MPNLAYSLRTIVDDAERLPHVRKTDLSLGDIVLVVTLNSTYTIQVMEGGDYLVSGGWFDRQGMSSVRTGISGCTWGGTAIKRDIVAACGLRLEFGNRLVTSMIRKIFVFPYGSGN